MEFIEVKAFSSANEIARKKHNDKSELFEANRNQTLHLYWP